MISTLTTSTISFAMTGMAESLATLGFLLLIALLAQKELASAAGRRFKEVSRTLNVAVVPLVIAFVLVIVSKVIEAIR